MIKYLLSREQLIIYCLAFFFTFFLMQLNFLNSSANFLYLAPPLFLIFTSKKIQIPHIDFQIAFIIYTAIFVIAALLQPMFWPDIFRKLVSFIIFMTAFLYTFINISDRMIAAFKIAIVIKRLPKTRSGKILRGTIRKIADNVEYKIPPTIDDPAILTEIKEDLIKHKILNNG